MNMTHETPLPFNNASGLFRQNIITSALDFDTYKLNMMQVVYEKFSNTEVEYDFKCRSDENIYDLMPQIRDEVNKLETIAFTEDQITYIAKQPHMKLAFVDYLRDFRFDPKRHIFFDKDDSGQLKITIKGSWLKTILYEIFILAIVSEVRNRVRFSCVTEQTFRKPLFDKVEYLKSEVKKRGLEGYFKFADFGTRRRYSYKTQYSVVEYMVKEIPEMFIGTSNVHLAKEFGITAIGTMAHEYLCAHQALVHPKQAVRKALENWNDVYRGNLGIALTDAITTDTFLEPENFDLMMSKMFDGVRHDSGCPFAWGDKIIAHYKAMNIDPMTKTLVFSDGLNFDLALDVAEYFKNMINFTFGIGTFLSNDLGDYVNEAGVKYKPLSIVIKLMLCNGLDVAKISDESGKEMCRSSIYINYLKEIHNIKIIHQ